MMNRIRIAAGALALVSAPLAAQKDAGETVELRFRWQPGMRADVEFEQIRLRPGDSAGPDSVRLASAYRMEVSRHPDGLRVGYTGTRWTQLPAADPTLGRFYEALARTSSGGRAETVVTRRGEFLRVEGAEEVAEELNRAVQPLLDEVEESTLANIRQTLAGMLSPEGLAASAADEWNALVGAWIDADLELGELYELEHSFETPAFPGVEIPVYLEFQAVRRAPCTPEDPEPRCVELALSSVPDQEVLAAALTDFLRRAGVPASQARVLFAQLNVHTEVSLLTEPGTLRPHTLRSTRIVTLGPEEDAPRQVEIRIFRFRYPP